MKEIEKLARNHVVVFVCFEFNAGFNVMVRKVLSL